MSSTIRFDQTASYSAVKILTKRLKERLAPGR